MANEPGNAVLDLFTQIVDRIKQSKPQRTDGKPLGGGMVYSQMVLGMPIDPRDFMNPWSPMGGSSLQGLHAAGTLPTLNSGAPGSTTAGAGTAETEPNPKFKRAMEAAFKTSKLCNLLLQVTEDNRYLEYPTGKHLDANYESIITGMQPMPMPPLSPEIQKQLDDAKKVLHELDDEGDIMGPSKRFKLYQENANAYAKAKAEFAQAQAAALADPIKAEIWPQQSVVFQRMVDNAWDIFKTAGAEKVERALAIIESVGVSMQDSLIVKARKRYDEWSLGLSGVADPVPYSFVSPTAWCDPKNDQIGFQKLVVTSSSYRHRSTAGMSRDSAGNWSTSSSASAASGGISVGFAAFRASKSAESSASAESSSAKWEFENKFSNSATDLEISLEYGLCTINRPWLMSDLFYTRNWFLVGEKKNSVSDGTIAGQVETAQPLLPMIPQQFLVIRNVKISSRSWGSDQELLASYYSERSQSESSSSSASSASGRISGGISLGWLNCGISANSQEAHAGGSNATHEDRKAAGQFSTNFDGTTLEISGAQIIAFLSDIVPACPPIDDPSLKS